MGCRAHLVVVQRALQRLHVAAGVAAAHDAWEMLKVQVLECLYQLGRWGQGSGAVCGGGHLVGIWIIDWRGMGRPRGKGCPSWGIGRGV